MIAVDVPDVPEPATVGPVGADGSAQVDGRAQTDPRAPDAVGHGEGAGVGGSRLRGPDALRVHLTLAFGLALCSSAFWFELGRALGGNSLSWAYVFEWPLFAVFAVYMWWNVLHGGRSTRRSAARSRATRPAVAPEYAGMLEAWEAHRRELLAAQAEQDAVAESGRPAPHGTGPVSGGATG